MTDEKITVEKDLLHYQVEAFEYESECLDRAVKLDAYLPKNIDDPAKITLLFINDGQDMKTLKLATTLDLMLDRNEISPILAIGMHCNEYRKLEYGTADVLDYQMFGSRARFHRNFILQELIPFIRKKYLLPQVKEIAFAGFSLGGLSAMDIAWKHPEIFTKVGLFSASFWWRTKALEKGYNEATDRIMHSLVRAGNYDGKQQYFFQCGTLDEAKDRNNNGIIDSIDDTQDLIFELEMKGCPTENIFYHEIEGGKHDVPTWALGMPEFLKWGWGIKK